MNPKSPLNARHQPLNLNRSPNPNPSNQSYGSRPQLHSPISRNSPPSFPTNLSNESSRNVIHDDSRLDPSLSDPFVPQVDTTDSSKEATQLPFTIKHQLNEHQLNEHQLNEHQLEETSPELSAVDYSRKDTLAIKAVNESADHDFQANQESQKRDQSLMMSIIEEEHRSSPTRSHLGVNALISMILTSLLFYILHSVGKKSAFAELFLGESFPHLMSQICTTALFFWGGAVLITQMIQFRRERQGLLKLNVELIPHKTPLISQFKREVSRGISASHSYLDARDLVTAAREGTLDELVAQERGVQAAMWLIPLSGFLGTVLGMSATIAQFDQLFNPSQGGKLLGLVELAPAIKGLSTAFDTTLLALALVIPLKLLLTFAQNSGERLTREIEQVIATPLLNEVAKRDYQKNATAQPLQENEELNLALTHLKAQSSELSITLREMTDTLSHFTRQLSQDPALSERARTALYQNIEQAVYQGVERAHQQQGHSGNQLSSISDQLKKMSVQQQENQHQLDQIQETLAAPMVIHRGGR